GPGQPQQQHGDHQERPARPRALVAPAELGLETQLLLAQAGVVLGARAGLGLLHAQAILALALALGHALGLEPRGLLGGGALGLLARPLLRLLANEPLGLGGSLTRLLLATHTVGFELAKLGQGDQTGALGLRHTPHCTHRIAIGSTRGDASTSVATIESIPRGRAYSRPRGMLPRRFLARDGGREHAFRRARRACYDAGT